MTQATLINTDCAKALRVLPERAFFRIAEKRIRHWKEVASSGQ